MLVAFAKESPPLPTLLERFDDRRQRPFLPLTRPSVKIVASVTLLSATLGTFNKAALGDKYPPARSTHSPTYLPETAALRTASEAPSKIESSLSEPHPAVRTGQGPLIKSQVADNGR